MIERIARGSVNAAYLSPLPMPQSAMDDTKWRPDLRHNYQKVTHPVARVRTSNTLQSTSMARLALLSPRQEIRRHDAHVRWA